MFIKAKFPFVIGCFYSFQMAARKDLSIEDEISDQNYGYKKDFRTALPQILAVSVKNLLLLGKSTTHLPIKF